MLALSARWLGSFSLRRDRAADFLEAMRSARRILENMIAHFRGPGDSELVGWFLFVEIMSRAGGFVGGHGGLLGDFGGDCENLWRVGSSGLAVLV
jgi:hypothetical protein